ncbi:MAG: Gfo/Idh/MocA family oxidoreductase [Victivallaceae bacterium]|nr:Gfo/Idh/MocA family oxidoreductase [Victivallaceae bacterium]
MKKLRVGIAGLGEFGELHTLVFSQLPYVEVKRVCSRTESRAREIADRYKIPSFCTNYDELATADDLDVISVVNFGKNHKRVVIPALESGKHVLVEKPMADKVEDAELMVNAAKTSAGKLMVAHICRFMPQYYRAKELASSGRLGKIALIQTQRNNHYSTLSPGRKKNPLRETAIHDIDLALWITGGRLESAHGYKQFNNSDQEADCCVATAKLDNGVICTFASSWLRRDAQPAGVDARMDIIGTGGELHIKMPPDNLVFIDDHSHSHFNPETSLSPVTIRQTALAGEIEYFLKCVLLDETPEVITPEAALESLRTTIKIDESCSEIR